MGDREWALVQKVQGHTVFNFLLKCHDLIGKGDGVRLAQGDGDAEQDLAVRVFPHGVGDAIGIFRCEHGHGQAVNHRAEDGCGGLVFLVASLRVGH